MGVVSMSYELFRTDVFTNLMESIPKEQISLAINAVDRAAIGYEISRKSMSLIVIDGVPEPLKIYIATKIAENLNEKTLKNYFYTMKNFFLTLSKSVDKITVNDIKCYLYDYKQRKGISDRTLEQIRICINGFYDWCTRMHIYYMQTIITHIMIIFKKNIDINNNL